MILFTLAGLAASYLFSLESGAAYGLIAGLLVAPLVRGPTSCALPRRDGKS